MATFVLNEEKAIFTLNGDTKWSSVLEFSKAFKNSDTKMPVVVKVSKISGRQKEEKYFHYRSLEEAIKDVSALCEGEMDFLTEDGGLKAFDYAGRVLTMYEFMGVNEIGKKFITEIRYGKSLKELERLKDVTWLKEENTKKKSAQENTAEKEFALSKKDCVGQITFSDCSADFKRKTALIENIEVAESKLFTSIEKFFYPLSVRLKA